MRRKTWADGNHHILPRATQKEIFGAVLDNTTVRMRGRKHVEVHRRIREWARLNPLRGVLRLTGKRK